MNNDDHLLTLKIDAYIKGQLSEVERQVFENDLQTNVILADRVQTQRAELVLLEKVAEENLRLKVRKWSAEIDDDENKPLRKWWQHPLSIFALLSSIVLGFFLVYSKITQTDATIQVSPSKKQQDTTQSKPTPKDLPKIDTIKKIDSKSQTQTPKPPIAIVEQTTVRNDLLAYAENIERTAERGDSTNTPLSKAVQFIQNQNFTSAQSALTSISSQAPNYADARFLLATIDYLQYKPQAAAATFKTLSETDGYLRKEQAAFYWAASLVADRQISEAKKILSLIAADAEHPKHDAAVVLLKSL